MASSGSNLCLDSFGTRRRNVVYSADYLAAVLGKTLATRRKLSQQSHRFRGDSRIRDSQYSVRRNGFCRRMVLSHESWSVADRSVHRRSHGIPDAAANVRAALRVGLLSRSAGHERVTLPPLQERLTTQRSILFHCTFTETSVFWLGVICTVSPSAIYFCRTPGSAHSKSQPSSMAMSVYRPGTTALRVKVPSESDWSRRNSAGLLFKSSGASTIITPAAGLSFLRAAPVIRPFPFEALMVTLTSWAVAISKERPDVLAFSEARLRMKSPWGSMIINS